MRPISTFFSFEARSPLLRPATRSKNQRTSGKDPFPAHQHITFYCYFTAQADGMFQAPGRPTL